MLSGTVYSKIDDNPIGGASISAYSVTTAQIFNTETDQETGEFSLVLHGSDYTLTINAEGHQERFASVTIESGVTLETTFYLDEVYSNMFFGVAYDSDGNRLDGVTVTANMNEDYDLSLIHI
mgnify:FL=1